jgi:hypothetical protein
VSQTDFFVVSPICSPRRLQSQVTHSGPP